MGELVDWLSLFFSCCIVGVKVSVAYIGVLFLARGLGLQHGVCGGKKGWVLRKLL